MEKRKVVIVGGSHAGHEAAIELMDKYKDVDVALYEVMSSFPLCRRASNFT